MLVASAGGKLGDIGFPLVRSFAEPFQSVRKVVGLGLGLRGRVPGDHGEILGYGDLGESIGVISAEAENRHFGESVAVNVVQSRNP